MKIQSRLQHDLIVDPKRHHIIIILNNGNPLQSNHVWWWTQRHLFTPVKQPHLIKWSVHRPQYCWRVLQMICRVLELKVNRSSIKLNKKASANQELWQGKLLHTVLIALLRLSDYSERGANFLMNTVSANSVYVF